MLTTAVTSYREFFRRDRRFVRLAAWIAALTIPLYVVLAVFLERVASGDGGGVLGVALVAVALGILVLEVLMDVWLIEYTVFRPQRRMQHGVLDHFLRRDPQRLAATPSGELSAAAIQYLDGAWFVRDGIRLAHALASVVILAVVIAQASVVLAAVSTLPLLLLGAAVLVVRRRWVAAYTAEREARTGLETFVTDVLRGVLTIKLFGAERRSTQRTAELSATLQRWWFRVEMQYTGVATVLNSLTLAFVPVFLTVGGGLIADGALSGAELVALFVVFNLLGYHAGTANSMASFVLNDLGQVRHVNEFLASETEGGQPIEVSQGGVAFEDVTVDGATSHEPVLEHVSLRIEPGEQVAVVGASGAGKTTLLALLVAMRSPSQGRVVVDGTPIGPHNARALRRNVSAVSQSAILFDTDLAFNLTLGEPVDPVEIDRVLDVVGLTGFVAALPDGLATRFGAGGFTLSGGERARVCLARALLRPRPMLLLDEVTAQVDAVHEREIMRNLLHDLPGVTLVAVSHRLTSVRDFPRIVLLDCGRLAAEGTHAELIDRSARYRELFGRQAAADYPVAARGGQPPL